MNIFLQKLYEFHHKKENRADFSIYEEERGEYFAKTIGKGKLVLDLGCRDGTLTKYYADNNEVLGIDIDKRLLQKAKEKFKIKTIHMDLYEPWKFDKKFDVIIAAEILEHLYYPERIVKKCYQLLKPKGVLLVSVPNAYIISARIRFLFEKEVPAHWDPTHINLFSERKLKDILEKYFNNVKVFGIAPPIYKSLHWLSNGLFADDLLAQAER